MVKQLLAATAAALTLSSVQPTDFIAESFVDDDRIVIYANGSGDEQPGIECAISGVKSEIRAIDSETVAQMDKYTLFLVDVSSSNNPVTRNITTDLLDGLIDGQDSSFISAVAVFSNEMKYMGDYTSDRYELSKQVDAIEFKGGNTNLYSSVVAAIENVEQESGMNYDRLIVISDGVEANRNGITYNELDDYLSGTSTQVYTIGIESNGNSQNLKNLFAMSRKTGAPCYTVNPATKLDDVCAEINSYLYGIDAYEIIIPDEMKDGTVKRVSILSDGTEISGKDTRMPMQVRETTTEPPETTPVTTTTTVVTTTTAVTTTQAAEPEPEPEPKGMDTTTLIIIIAAGVVAAAAIITVIVIIVKKNAAKNVTEPEPEPVVQEDTGKTEFFPDTADASGKTSFLYGGNDEPKVIVTLEDIDNQSRRFTKSISVEGVSVTREKSSDDTPQIVIDYDKSISRNHCTLFLKEDMVYIRDNGSLNKTYVNGKTAETEIRLKEGDILKLGRVKLRVAEIKR
ncbi:MAG: FHA domain-containing protein [Ruminiclostridium sp.]|nr:FHA domain-containing protein [Ruminiclostridium sp.]